MPTYDYECRDCGHRWEADQTIKAEPLKECPSCKALQAKRLVSTGTKFILKGGGWASEGYASKG